MQLFDEAALRKLEQLTLVADSVRVGTIKGDRRSHRRGTSIEFADYRDYTQGDDLRRLDWNIYARLSKPFIKLTDEEEDLAVHILVDTSDSMNWPIEETEVALNKLRYGLKLAGGLGYIGLLAGDLVSVTLFDSGGHRNWGPFRGRQNGWPLIQFLEVNYGALKSDQAGSPRKTTLDVSLSDYALRARRPGLIFIVTDLLTGGDYRRGLTALLSRGYEIAIIHLLSPDELMPDLSGDLQLIDIETGNTAEVSIDPLMLEEYSKRITDWQKGIAEFCRPRGIHYIPQATDTPWERSITHSLQQEGVVR